MATQDPDVAAVVKAYVDGASIRQIAEDIGRSYGLVHKLLTAEGVQLRPRGGAPSPPATAPAGGYGPPATDPAEVLRGIDISTVDARPGEWVAVFCGDNTVCRKLTELVRAGAAPFAPGRYQATLRAYDRADGPPKVWVRCIRPADGRS